MLGVIERHIKPLVSKISLYIRAQNTIQVLGLGGKGVIRAILALLPKFAIFAEIGILLHLLILKTQKVQNGDF